MLWCGVLAVSVAFAAAAPQPYNVLELDLTPEEAQKYLSQPPFNTPQLSGRTAVLPLIRFNDPRFRSGESGPTNGHYWKNGKEIENTDDYVEEVYDASQFHGQDGLGAYAYGYETPESAKVENRERAGNVAGEYTYRAGPGNDLIKVRYWADSQGFHQEDNLPKVVLKPQEEAEDVRQARLAHEKAWQEAAAASRKQPDPQGDYYPQYQASASQNQASYANPLPALPSYIKAVQPDAAASEQQAAYVRPNQTPTQYSADQQYYTTPEPEPTGPPRGFFYSFNYPVSIIVPKNELNQAGHPVDHDTVAHGQLNYNI
ncbi:uncharacterized protein LOC121731156 [Aricia agestis]|uniref:uncharacterized protein LOC121731156 n=1 Tax=Aricia agestis TaxID=91739 RepID=UPI001C20A927|nr:uncharacterized protein LOC121731156 [Aricia agestis]